MYYLTKEDYDVAKANGISNQILYHRYYSYNWDVKRAITEPLGASKRSTPNMVLWEKWKDAAESIGVSKHNFYNRLNSTRSKRKWTPEEAATIPLGVRKHTRIHPKIYALAEKNGISITTLRNRVYNPNQKWSPYRAATEPIHSLTFNEFIYHEGIDI